MNAAMLTAGTECNISLPLAHSSGTRRARWLVNIALRDSDRLPSIEEGHPSSLEICRRRRSFSCLGQKIGNTDRAMWIRRQLGSGIYLSLEFWESNESSLAGSKELSRCIIEMLWDVELIENY